VIYHTRITL